MEMEISGSVLGYENLKLTFGSWSPTPSLKWDFGILAELDSASKVGN